MTWDTWLAVVALLLSMWSLARLYLSGRKAHVIVWFASVPNANASSHRIVIENRGPADARGISMEVTGPNGSTWEQGRFDHDLLPIPVLAAGDQFHMRLSIALGGPDSLGVVATWRDGRTRAQRRSSTLSTVGIPIAPRDVRGEMDRATRDAAAQYNLNL